MVIFWAWNFKWTMSWPGLTVFPWRARVVSLYMICWWNRGLERPKEKYSKGRIIDLPAYLLKNFEKFYLFYVAFWPRWLIEYCDLFSDRKGRKKEEFCWCWTNVWTLETFFEYNIELVFTLLWIACPLSFELNDNIQFVTFFFFSWLLSGSSDPEDSCD